MASSAIFRILDFNESNWAVMYQQLLQAHADLTTAQNQIVALQNALPPAGALAPPPVVPVIPPAPPAAKEPKLADPADFSGDRKQTRLFVMQCRNVFAMQPSRYDTDDKMIRKAISHFTGAALQWISTFAPILNSPTATRPAFLTTFDAFADKLESVFGVADRRQEAIRALESLHQTKSASTYATEFLRYAAETGYNDEALIRLFRRGLKDSRRRALLSNTVILALTNLTDYIEAVIQIDDQMWELELDERGLTRPNDRYPRNHKSDNRPPQQQQQQHQQRNFQTRPANSPRQTTQQSPPARQDGSTPMEIDGARTPRRAPIRPTNANVDLTTICVSIVGNQDIARQIARTNVNAPTQQI